MFLSFLLGPFLNWLPRIFLGGLWLLGCYFYFRPGLKYSEPKSADPAAVAERPLRQKPFFWLIISATIFYLGFAICLTLGQYYVWSNNEFTRTFLRAPVGETVPIPSALGPFAALFHNPLGYFIFYSYGRFWLHSFIAIGIALLFYLFLRSLQKYRERFFYEGETELGFLTALTVGWPGFVLYLPLTLLSVILISLFRRYYLKELYTTMGSPLLLASLVALLFGDFILKALQLNWLYIVSYYV